MSTSQGEQPVTPLSGVL